MYIYMMWYYMHCVLPSRLYFDVPVRDRFDRSGYLRLARVAAGPYVVVGRITRREVTDAVLLYHQDQRGDH